MSGMKFVIAGLGALAIAACSTTPANNGMATAPAASGTSDSTGSGTAPPTAQPTPPANQDGSPPATPQQ